MTPIRVLGWIVGLSVSAIVMSMAVGATVAAMTYAAGFIEALSRG